MPLSQPPENALALRNQYRQWESRAARLSLLVDTGRELPSLPPDAMCAQVMRRAAAFCAMDRGAVLRWDGHGRDRQVVAHFGPTSPDAWLAALSPDISAIREACCAQRADAALPVLLQLPLSGATGEPFGVVLVASHEPINPPDAEDLESLRLLATVLATHLENERLQGDLRARERTMSELVHRLMAAQEDERRRVAYDLHDGVAQTLAGLHQHLQGYAGRYPPQSTAQGEALNAILGLAQRCVRETRQAIAGLRPQSLDDFGLAHALDREADRLREAGLRVTWENLSDARLLPDAEITLFRIAQEAINNVLKHAGPCHVRLSLAIDETDVALRVQDDGHGFDYQTSTAASGGHRLGLAAMRERATLLGGSVACQSEPGRGTRLVARLPLTRPETP
ncbi:GAF domain-containing sensor histidine kinase [Pseudomonas sp. Marseille-QA0892]